jgi:decaprenyl-phosphate phosphoribosyltransferase
MLSELTTSRETADTRILPALVRLTRPRQWLKNLLVFAAPAAAGVLGQPVIFAKSVAAFWIFVGLSAATYLINDVVDRERDSLHPVKCNRPVASGLVKPSTAVRLAIVLAAVSLAAAGALSLSFLAVTTAYFAISLAYSLALKRVVGVELACVAAGFVLRAVGGGAATGVYISPWFLVMTAAGALLLVVGKRSVEQAVLGEEAAKHRPALAHYPPWLLTALRWSAIVVTIATYSLWAFTRSGALAPRGTQDDMIWFELSIIPFVLAVGAVERSIERGDGGEPEEMALKNHWLQLFGAIWLVFLLLGVYG